MSAANLFVYGCAPIADETFVPTPSEKARKRFELENGDGDQQSFATVAVTASRAACPLRLISR